MQRICFLLHVRPDKISDYKAAHEAVWPDMLAALKSSGWHDYSLFLDETTGLVVGVLDTDDFDDARRLMAETEINDRWQRSMAPYFVDAEAATPALPRIFHLETQLAAARPTPENLPS